MIMQAPIQIKQAQQAEHLRMLREGVFMQKSVSA
jgi:hypothetical protein